MHITLLRQNTAGSEQVTCTLPDSLAQTRPTVLQALKFIQAKQLPDLAYRYGCRDGLCGVCTLNVNGRPKLACRAKVKENDLLSALDTLPVVKDFVVRRDHINKAVRQQIPVRMEKHNGECEDYSALHKLNKCIECYACLSGCSLHAKNKTPGETRYGNPYLFLKIQKVLVDPMSDQSSRQQAVNTAIKLGIQRYDEKKVPHCGVGINLKKDVILPLKNAACLTAKSE